MVEMSGIMEKYVKTVTFCNGKSYKAVIYSQKGLHCAASSAIIRHTLTVKGEVCVV